MTAVYNVTLSPFSPMFTYTPSRDGPAATTWNASYTGATIWPQRPDVFGDGEVVSEPAGRAYRRTQAVHSNTALAFRGMGFILCFSTNGAHYTVDTEPKLAVTTASRDQAKNLCGVEAEDAVFAYGLEDGDYTVTMFVAADAGHEFRFFGGQIGIDVGDSVGSTVVSSNTIDDSAEGWDKTVAPTFPWDDDTRQHTLYNTTSTFNCGYSNSVTISRAFTNASGIVLLGEVWRDSHSFSILLDDQPVREMDATSSWADSQAVFFATGGLDPSAVHRVTLVNYAANDPDCTTENLTGDREQRFCCLSLDALVLLRGTGTNAGDSVSGIVGTNSVSQVASSTPFEEPTQNVATVIHRVNIAVVASTVIIGVIILALVGFLVFFLIRRRRQTSGRDKVEPHPIEYLRPEHRMSVMVEAPWSPPPTMVPAKGSLTSLLLPPAGGTPQLRTDSPFTSRHPGKASGPASVTSSTASSTPMVQNRMTEDDLQRVFLYVAARMDSQTADQRGTSAKTYPGALNSPR
ncbi:hypothetical protein BKA62DRAFT_711425 [Auriculariales sp. MPI-PUGE-AT-0066]|nr:hypothetical protein BKA62DRAFT_711425 [Auriculariales sp. MPI-PUGE-AT-0066]